MKIFVRDLLSGKSKTMTLNVNSSDTIGAVMAQLHDPLGFPPAMQLIYANNGAAALRHDAAGTLADHKVKEGSMLRLHGSAAGWRAFKAQTLRGLGFDVAASEHDAAQDASEKMRVLVRDHLDPAGRGRTVVLEVETGDTVAGVMAQVQARLGYPPVVQRLTYDGEELCRDSGWTLAEHYVSDGSVLELDMSFPGAVAAVAEIEARKIESGETEGVERVQQQQLTGDKTAAQELAGSSRP